MDKVLKGVEKRFFKAVVRKIVVKIVLKKQWCLADVWCQRRHHCFLVGMCCKLLILCPEKVLAKMIQRRIGSCKKKWKYDNINWAKVFVPEEK